MRRTLSAPLPSVRRRRAIVRRLLDWYRVHRRDLPWRHRKDPYAVWVSEVMLQQTQVRTVIPYYERWMQRFPDLATLAAAPVDSVLEAWQGLGYYGRARRLLEGARVVVSDHGGRLPRSAQSLNRLPGIGPYSAGAISSIAFDERVPLVDGNVSRVLCRLEALDGDPTRAPTKGLLWALADSLVPADWPGDFNQALMELGATVCLPRQPDCADCPIGRLCKARRLGKAAELPRAPGRQQISRVSMVAAVVRSPAAGVLVVRQPESASRWSGLWMFPSAPLPARHDPKLAVRTLVRQAAGLEVSIHPRTERFVHCVTRYRINLDVYHCRTTARRPPTSDRILWKMPTELERLAMPAVHRRIARSLLR